MIRVLVWNEFKHEQEKPKVAEIYPNGIHGTIAEFLGKEEDIVVKTAINILNFGSWVMVSSLGLIRLVAFIVLLLIGLFQVILRIL